MKTLTYESWVIDYDDELTREIFKKVVSGPESCTCSYCKNFLAAREQVYPDSFKKILNQLGVDYQKETEIYQCAPIESGRHLYGGWFHFAGQIRKAPVYEEINISRVPKETDFEWSFSRDQCLIPKAFGQNPVVQINWVGAVPWIIGEEEQK